MDLNFLMFIRENLTTPFLDWLMTFVSALGDGGFIWLAIGLGLLFFKKTRKCGIFMLLSLALGYILGNLVLKNIFARTRPYLAHSVSIIIPPPSEFSFPSGHALASFSASFSVFKFNKKWGALAICFALLIAFSRMYLFVHYPTDILGSFALSFLIVFLTDKLLSKIKKYQSLN